MTEPDKPRKRGRPATGRDLPLMVRMPKDLHERLNAFAERRSMNRSVAFRLLLDAGLTAKGFPPESEG